MRKNEMEDACAEDTKNKEFAVSERRDECLLSLSTQIMICYEY